MKALVAVSALVAMTLGLAAWEGGRASAAHASFAIPAPTESSSVILHGGRIRCTASVSSVVAVGHAVSVKFTLHNVSKHSAKVRLWVFSTAVVLKATDGTTYDSSAPLANFFSIPPPSPPKTMRPRATWHLGRVAVPVRWTGPLQVTPECLGKALPVLRVGVAVPWPGPNESAAIGEIVAAAGHLLDHCRPQTPGVPVDGQINPPSGTAPPMNAQCSVTVSSEGSFLVAQVLVIIPTGLTGVQVFQPYETLWPNGHPFPSTITASPPYEAIAWEFVVTRYRAIPVAASSVAATNDSPKTAPFFGWNGTGWQLQGDASCGGGALSWGGTGPNFEFISACSD